MSRLKELGIGLLLFVGVVLCAVAAAGFYIIGVTVVLSPLVLLSWLIWKVIQ